MAKINQFEYELLKGLDDEWKWIARDDIGVLGLFMKKPKKYKLFLKFWSDNISPPRYIDDAKFQFIQWEDDEPYNIADLIDEYEGYVYTAEHYSSAMRKLAKALGDSWNEREETEMSFKEKLKQEVEKIMTVTEYDGGWTVIKKVDVDKLFDLLDQLDEPTLSKKVQLSQKWAVELNRYKERGYSLKDLLVIAGSKQAQEKLARAWLDGYEVEEEQKYIISINITDKASKTKYETFLNKRGIFHSMENDSFNSEEFNWTEEEIKDLESGDILFEHFAVKVEELEE